MAEEITIALYHNKGQLLLTTSRAGQVFILIGPTKNRSEKA